MTIASSSNAIKTTLLEFVFKGKGIRVKVNPPEHATAQWSDKGSNRAEHVLKYIESLPTILIHFTPGKRRIFTLGNYPAHLVPEVEEAFFKKGYFLVIIGGGITGDIQLNGTSHHRQAKALYRKHEMELILKKLQKDPPKIPQPTRDKMMNMFQKSWNETCAKVNNENLFKTNMITIALDGSEDQLASKNLMDLVGTETLEFWKKLRGCKPVSTLKELRLQIMKPEGVRMKGSNNQIPPVESFELLMAME